MFRRFDLLLSMYIACEVIRSVRQVFQDTENDDVDNISNTSSMTSFSDTSSSSDDFENVDPLDLDLDFTFMLTPMQGIQAAININAVTTLTASSSSSSSSGLSISSDSIITTIVDKFLFNDNEDEDLEVLYWPPELVREMLEHLDFVIHSRYLVPRKRLRKSDEWRVEIALNDPIKRVKAFFRMEPESVRSLVRVIEDDPIFQNNSNCPQRPVLDQVPVLVHLVADALGSRGVAVFLLGWSRSVSHSS